MSDHAYAYLAAAAGLLVLAVIILTAAGRARRERILTRRTQHAARTKGDAGLALIAEDHSDDLMGLADGLFVHPQCRQRYAAGFRSNVHRDCLNQLDREGR